jgi:hypothetical protein
MRRLSNLAAAGLVAVLGLCASVGHATAGVVPNIGSGGQTYGGTGNCTIQVTVTESPDQSKYETSGSMPAVSSWGSTWSVSCPGLADIIYMELDATIGTSTCGQASGSSVNALSLTCPTQYKPAAGPTDTKGWVFMRLTNPNALYAVWPSGCGASNDPGVAGYVDVNCMESFSELILPAIP